MGLVSYKKPVRRNTLSTYNSLFDNFFDDFFTKDIETKFSPSVDVKEANDNYQINLTLPGLTKEEVDIEVKDGVLSVKGEIKKEELSEGESYHRVESKYGSFQRSFKLPDNVNLDDISGQFEHGILKLTLPKDEVKVTSRKIELK